MEIAEVGDFVIIAGKGHESYQEIGDMLYPFDDRQVVTECLTNILWAYFIFCLSGYDFIVNIDDLFAILHRAHSTFGISCGIDFIDAIVIVTFRIGRLMI